MSKQDKVSTSTKEQQETRERIIAAASKVLAEKGYEATTLREISREAQAAPGLVHYYFGGKDQLLVEVLYAAGQRFHQRMTQLLENLSAEQSIVSFLAQLRERVELEPDVYRLRYESFSLGLHNALLAPKVQERLAQRREEIALVVKSLIGKVRPKGDAQSDAPDAMALSALLLAIFDGLALQKLMQPTFDLDVPYHLLERMLQNLLTDDSHKVGD